MNYYPLWAGRIVNVKSRPNGFIVDFNMNEEVNRSCFFTKEMLAATRQDGKPISVIPMKGQTIFIEGETPKVDGALTVRIENMVVIEHDINWLQEHVPGQMSLSLAR